jgi:hypothetical protein
MHVTFTLIPAASTSAVSVQVPGFEDIGLLTPCDRLICDFCSSGRCFAFSFLQIPSRDGHPCRWANRSPCRADSGLSPPSHPATTTVTETAPVKALRAMPGAPKKRAGISPRSFNPRGLCRPHSDFSTRYIIVITGRLLSHLRIHHRRRCSDQPR